MDYCKDDFGRYIVTFKYLEPDNNKEYEFRKYDNSVRIKALGGMYALCCLDDNKIIFRKSEYLRDRSYKKFSEDNCDDVIDFSNINGTEEVFTICKKKIDVIKKKHSYYSLPGKIDKSKLTAEEFETLRNLIKKGLVTD